MKSKELKSQLLAGALDNRTDLYSDTASATKRIIDALEKFESLYGEDREVYVLSVPGRSEICGNHTDHNGGCVLAGAINRDIIAIASPNGEGVVRLKSEGYEESVIDIADTTDKTKFESFTSRALIGGMLAGFMGRGYEVGGFDAYTTTEVLRGSGLSSSAAFEVMIGNILNYLFNNGKVDNQDIAILAREAENNYFGKPCGLMDQMACAVGGFVFIDFEKGCAPVVKPTAFSLFERGYSLCIVNTGGNHANLNDDYASVPQEMRSVASHFGKETLRGITEEEIIAAIPSLRAEVGDRAILRALHFVRENNRVTSAYSSLVGGDFDSFLLTIRESGRSSFEYLQNVYTTINVGEQGLSLALALTDGYMEKSGAYRVHGGGFAGTIQVFIPTEMLAGYVELVNSVFGEGAAMPLNIRPYGACRLF